MDGSVHIHTYMYVVKLGIHISITIVSKYVLKGDLPDGQDRSSWMMSVVI